MSSKSCSVCGEEIKKHLDLYSGSDRGRIWRVVPEGFKRPQPPALSGQSPGDLAGAMATANGWERDTMMRLILEQAPRDERSLLGYFLTAGLDRGPEGRVLELEALTAEGGEVPAQVLADVAQHLAVAGDERRCHRWR